MKVAHRTTPSLSRASVEAFAPVLAAQQAEAQRRKEELQLARKLRMQGPQDGDVWLDVATSAILTGLPAARIVWMIHSQRLPATQVGRRWWLRRLDVEQAAAARVFAAAAAIRE